MDLDRKENQVAGEIIAAAIEVHKELGPGLLESAYQACLAYELDQRKLAFQTEVPLTVKYKDKVIEPGYRLDFLVEDLVVVELKSVDKITPVHEAQLLTYLRLSGFWLGLLINFNVNLLKHGIRRRVLGTPLVYIPLSRIS